MAGKFQDYHERPFFVITENHLDEMEPVLVGTCIVSIGSLVWTGEPHLALVYKFVVLFGMFGSLNQYF